MSTLIISYTIIIFSISTATFCSVFHSAESLTANSDFEALKAFKSSIKPSTIPSYSCLGSWNFTSGDDPCSALKVTHFLCGLSCSGDRVTQLVLDKAGYSGTLSPLISKLTQLIVLDLQENDFYGQIPNEISSLPNLQSLVLRANSFSGKIPPEITKMKSLQSLDLSQNSISGSLPESIASLSSLRRLDLSFNRLTGSISMLPSSLIELAIKGNSLTGSLKKSTFSESTQLEVVELSANSLAGDLEPWFFQLPALQQVNLSNNSFTRVTISKPTTPDNNLVAVDLGFNQIDGYLPVNFSFYPALTSLSLRYNRLRGPIPLQYSRQQSLRRLFLDGNFLDGSPPAGLFHGGASVSGSIGDNCLRQCPISSELCSKPQKPQSICQQAYGGKPRY